MKTDLSSPVATAEYKKTVVGRGRWVGGGGGLWANHSKEF